MTKKIRRLLEELGSAAAEPVHSEEQPKEHTPSLSNDDVIEGQHAEEVKEIVVESGSRHKLRKAQALEKKGVPVSSYYKEKLGDFVAGGNAGADVDSALKSGDSETQKKLLAGIEPSSFGKEVAGASEDSTKEHKRNVIKSGNQRLTNNSQAYLSESYTQEELLDLFEGLGLNTEKYTFEYLSEKLGFTKLSEELGDAAAEPVHSEEKPEEHTPEVSNSDVIDGQHAEEIKEIIVESYSIMSNFNNLSDEDFASFINECSDEELFLLEEAVLVIEDTLLNEGLIFGNNRGLIRRDTRENIANAKNTYASNVSRINDQAAARRAQLQQSISRGFLGLGGNRAKMIKDQAAAKRNELRQQYQQMNSAAKGLKMNPGESQADYFARRIRARMDAQNFKKGIGKQAKDYGRQQFDKFERKQQGYIKATDTREKNKLAAEEKLRDDTIAAAKGAGQAAKDDDWRKTSLVGKVYDWFDQRKQQNQPQNQNTQQNQGTQQTTGSKAKVLPESYTRDELVELFEALNLDTHKFTFEYLAEELGFAAAEPVHSNEAPEEHTPEVSNDDVIDGQHAEEIKEIIIESLRRKR